MFYSKNLLNKRDNFYQLNEAIKIDTKPKEDLLKKQINARQKVSQAREIGEKWEEIMKKEMNNYKCIKDSYHKSAKLIQKHVRRYLTSLKTEEMILQRRTEEAN